MTVEVGILASESVLPDEVLKGGEAQPADTPYGPPSSRLRIGDFGGVRIAVIRRHGHGHTIPPHAVNHRANVAALRDLKPRAILAANSVGSLREDLAPGSLMVPHDYVALWDVATFHDDAVVHVTPGISPELLDAAKRATGKVDFPVRIGGVYVQTRGPRLETAAEIAVLKGFGDVVGMTMGSEATLAAEAGLDYLSICSVDNYAHGLVEGEVDWKDIVAVQKENAGRVREFLAAVLGVLP